MFGGFYWHIIRMNGDGLVRVIYDGTAAHGNGKSDTDRRRGMRACKWEDGDNACVGDIYGRVGA